MVNYNKSTIYKLCCNDLDIKEIYIGSTTNFNKRKNQHKSDCNNEKYTSYNYYVYKFIRDHGGFQNWSMVEIEMFDARDKKNLHRRERHWIENEKASLNSRKSYITEEEIKGNRVKYNAENANKIKDKKAEYYTKNADKIKEYQNEYNVKNADKIKEYYANNADKIKAKLAEKVTCSCGSNISKSGISSHLKTKKHQTFLEQLPNTL